MVLSKVTRNFQVTIPKEVREQLHLQQGMHMAWSIEDGAVVMRPLVMDPDQAWFWTEEWQEGEREADRDIAEGRVSGPFETAEELIRHLRHEDLHE